MDEENPSTGFGKSTRVQKNLLGFGTFTRVLGFGKSTRVRKGLLGFGKYIIEKWSTNLGQGLRMMTFHVDFIETIA